METKSTAVKPSSTARTEGVRLQASHTTASSAAVARFIVALMMKRVGSSRTSTMSTVFTSGATKVSTTAAASTAARSPKAPRRSGEGWVVSEGVGVGASVTSWARVSPFGMAATVVGHA